MKKFFHFLFMAVIGLSALSCYDDTAILGVLDEHKELIEELGADVDALKVLAEAVEKSDYITSVEIIEENGVEVGYTITFYKHGKITVYYCQGGSVGGDSEASGDSIFKEVYEKDGYMYFVLNDGTVYKVPMTAGAPSASFDIEFDVEPEMLVVPETEYLIPYTVIGADAKTSVRVITNEKYVKAYARPETTSEGVISVRIMPYDDDDWVSEEYYQSQLSFMVTVMDGRGNSVVKAVNLKKGILSLYDSAYTVEEEGGQLSVLVKTNMEYEVVLQSEVTWLSYSPKTKSEIRTDELLFNVQPNEAKTSRNTEVYLVDNDGNHLESIYIYQRGNGGTIVMDGDFSDWGQLDSCDVVVSTCAPDAYKNGLKTMMAFADGENLNVYLEMDFDVVVNRGEEWEGNPVDIYLSYSPDTGGYDNWSDMCVDYLLELQVFYGKHSYSSDDFVQLYSWTGGTHDGGWNWEQFTEVQVQVARTYNLCEIAINQRVLEELSGTPVDEFSIGATVSQWWESVGILPNANVTDENPRGMAPMLALNGENNAPLPPVGPVDPIEPEVSVVGLIGDFNNWNDDLIMYDNGEGWYVADVTMDQAGWFAIRMNRDWSFHFSLSTIYESEVIQPGVQYELELNNGYLNPYISQAGIYRVYVSKDFRYLKYEVIETEDPEDESHEYQWSVSLSEMGALPGRVGVGALGDKVVFAANGELWCVDEATGKNARKICLPDGFVAGGVHVDDVGNLLVSSQDRTWGNEEKLQVYKVDPETFSFSLLIDYDVYNIYCAEVGNVRVRGNVNDNALITAYVATGSQDFYLAWEVVSGVVGDFVFGGLHDGSWDASTGVVAPAGPSLSDGLFSILYADSMDLHYYNGPLYNYTTSDWSKVYVTGSTWMENYNCISTAEVNGFKYLALTACCHFEYDYTELIILDVTDPLSVNEVYKTQINDHALNNTGLTYSDVFIKEEDGKLAAYVIDPWMDTLDKYLLQF